MAPNSFASDLVQEESPKDDKFGCDLQVKLSKEIGTEAAFKRKIVWLNVFGLSVLHIWGIYGIGAVFFAKALTFVYAFVVSYASMIGVTMGAHRLWTHRAFKANKWVRGTLLFLFTLAGQNSLWEWVRDHRQHHKYSDTDADPHNATRGFFFSHVGWLMSRKHPKVIEYGKKIDMSDLEADPLVMFQRKYFLILYTIFSVYVTSAIPVYFWGESVWKSLSICFALRSALTLNGTWLVNSAAHMFGMRPFDKNINPVDTGLWPFFGVGEGWHNYHHAFPWDYKAAELGTPHNITRQIIDFCARQGWTWDLKEASSDLVQKRINRVGDGSHKSHRE